MGEIEELRKRKFLELQKKLEEEQGRAEQEKQAELQIKQIISQILTQEARERLTRIKLARPDFAAQIELLLMQLAQQGKIRGKITDEQFKKVLEQLTSGQQKKEFKFKRIEK